MTNLTRPGVATVAPAGVAPRLVPSRGHAVLIPDASGQWDLRGTVNVLNPACGVYGGTGLGPGDKGLGIQRALAFDVHALGIGVLLVAGIHGHPGVGLFVDGAATGDVVHECFDPDVFEFDECDLSAGSQADAGDAALPHELLDGFGFDDAVYPVHGFVGRDLDGAVDVAGGDVCGAQKADEEAGGVEAVAAFGLQSHVRTLDGAVGGEVFDGVSDPVVDLHGVVVQAGGKGFDCGGEGVSSVAARSSAVGVSGKLVAGKVKPLGMGPARWMACGLNRLVFNSRSVGVLFRPGC